AIGLLYFIRRGKQCLDFTATVHFFHLLGCWIYNGYFPTALTWWLTCPICQSDHTQVLDKIHKRLGKRTDFEKRAALHLKTKSNFL
ncbi:Protein SYS1-like protein, partial [Ophiophagus hannah]